MGCMDKTPRTPGPPEDQGIMEDETREDVEAEIQEMERSMEEGMQTLQRSKLEAKLAVLRADMKGKTDLRNFINNKIPKIKGEAHQTENAIELGDEQVLARARGGTWEKFQEERRDPLREKCADLKKAILALDKKIRDVESKLEKLGNQG